MAQPQIVGVGAGRIWRFHWESILPRRKDWIQTAVLLPFGLPIAHFLGSNWNFAYPLMAKEHQYLTGMLALGASLLLPSLFFACLFHWGWFIWKQEPKVWYPDLRGWLKGCYATATIGISCGLVELFAQQQGVCGNSDWSEIAQSLVCNLDDYGFESKSWFGVWFILAAYCYRLGGTIDRLYERIANKHSS
jgi:hypothetical protein